MQAPAVSNPSVEKVPAGQSAPAAPEELPPDPELEPELEPEPEAPHGIHISGVNGYGKAPALRPDSLEFVSS
jgi:hypothetical protein